MSILLGRTRTTSAFLFFFNDTATTEIYTLSLHDALPISAAAWKRVSFSISLRHWAKALARLRSGADLSRLRISGPGSSSRSEEHTSELQSRLHLVCRLLLEKKKKKKDQLTIREALPPTGP